MSQTQKGVVQETSQSQQEKEIRIIFDEFKDPQTNSIDTTEFLNILKQTGVAKNCQLLVQKLEKLMGRKIKEDDFNRLFNFNFDEEDNFELLFDLIDTSKSGRIGKEELKRANNLYQLQLTERDIEVMINYSGSQEKETISKDSLWALMASQNK